MSNGIGQWPARRKSRDATAEVTALVAGACRAMSADPEVCMGLGIPHWAAQVTLTVELTRLVSAALAGRADDAVPRFIAFLRGRPLNHDQYDRFAHYLLTVALEQGTGPDRLLRLGRTLTDIRTGLLLGNQPGPGGPPLPGTGTE